MVKTPHPAPTRDQRREHIIQVAREVFFELGYGATSMSIIAARLGGSKGTLYNYFKSKEELFEAQVRDMCGHAADRILEPIESGRPAEGTGAEAGPVETLTRMGTQYLEHLFSEQTARMFRILIPEAQRSPELARIFYEVGPARSRKGLESYLERARAQSLLDVPDCALAADQFLALCKGSTHLKFLLNLIPPLTAAEISAQAGGAVQAFVTLYGPKVR